MADDAYARSAAYYDTVYADVDYAGDVAYLQEAFRRFAPAPVKRVLDLGAGAGGHAIPLARAGFDVTALDLSEPLVDLLRTKALREGVQVRARVGDMTRDVPAGAFDAAICMFGAFCYLHEDEDVARLLAQLRERLPTGGLLVFEFWSPLGWRPQKWFEEHALPGGRRLVRLTTPSLHLERDVYRFAMEYLVLSETALVERFVEAHGLRLRTPHQTQQLLEAHGFEVAAFTSGGARGVPKSFEKPAHDAFRVMAIARRS